MINKSFVQSWNKRVKLENNLKNFLNFKYIYNIYFISYFKINFRESIKKHFNFTLKSVYDNLVNSFKSIDEVELIHSQ